MKKSLMERHLENALKSRRKAKRDIINARKTYESLLLEEEDLSFEIHDLRDCLKRGLYEGGAS
mgnify:CR=1 FL=1